MIASASGTARGYGSAFYRETPKSDLPDRLSENLPVGLICRGFAKGGAVPNQNIENNPMYSKRQRLRREDNRRRINAPVPRNGGPRMIAAAQMPED